MKMWWWLEKSKTGFTANLHFEQTTDIEAIATVNQKRKKR